MWNGGMSFHGGSVGVTVAIIALRPGQPDSTCCAWPTSSLPRADRPVLRPHRQFHQRRAVGPGDSRALGHGLLQPHHRAAYDGDLPGGLAPRHPSQLYEAALEGLVLFLDPALGDAPAATGCSGRARSPDCSCCLRPFPHRAGERAQARRAACPMFPLGLTMGMMLSAPMVAGRRRADLAGAASGRLAHGRPPPRHEPD